MCADNSRDPTQVVATASSTEALEDTDGKVDKHISDPPFMAESAPVSIVNRRDPTSEQVLRLASGALRSCALFLRPGSDRSSGLQVEGGAVERFGDRISHEDSSSGPAADWEFEFETHENELMFVPESVQLRVQQICAAG